LSTTNVVVTGVGMWTPYGQGVHCFWNGLMSGVSAFRTINRFDAKQKQYRSSIGAIIPKLGEEHSGDAERTMPSIVASVLREATDDAKITNKDASVHDVSVVMGVTQGLPPRERISSNSTEPRSAVAALGSNALLNLIASQSMAQGQITAISTACASGTQSIGVGFDLIRDGRARRAIVGGISYFSEISFSGFNILRALSRNGCRPFDQDRDGITLGDACVIIVLEDERLAQERSARTYARILGYASGNEAFHATAPEPNASAGHMVMRKCLSGSPENLEQLDYINAHGTGTLANDGAELLAIEKLANLRSSEEQIAVSSTKGHHGHALGAAGSIEFAATLLALVHKSVPPTLGLQNPLGTSKRVHLVRGNPIKRDLRVALSSSFAFGGNVAAVAIGAP
jgi:3-oxoacyl-[acyl-carrier-protein] synthase II